MPKAILMDEFHLSMFAPAGLRGAEYAAIRRALDGVRFRTRLVRAIRHVIGQYPPLHQVRVTVTR